MNPVLTQLLTAQEAYTETVKVWEGVDTTEALLAAAESIKAAIALGRPCCGIGGLDSAVAEKAAVELTQIGYNARTMDGGARQMPDGTIRQTVGIAINWIYMPSNARDGFTV